MSGASALEIEKLTDTGIKLGYKDEELREYVRKERELLKEERDAERDARAKERAFKEKEMEENKKAMQAKEHEIIMLMKLEELKKENAAAGANATAEKSKAKIPKLPMFNDDKDDLDAYLQRFERYATLQSWKKENWALNLSALLSGKALDVYSTLPSSEAQNYDTLKLALLRKYNLTEDGYRTKFKTSKPKDDETASQYAARLGNYLNKWTDIVKIQQSYKGLREFMIIDQFMHSIPKDMALFLKERQPTSAGLDNIIKMASQYLEAHGNSWSQNTHDKNKRVGPNIGKGPNSKKPPSHTGQDENQSKSEGQNASRKQFKCYFCQKPGHSWRNCLKAPKSFVPNMAMLIDALKTENKSSSESNQMNSNTQINQGCANCSLNETDKFESIACMKTQGDHHLDSAVQEGHLELKCGHRIPLLSAACKCSGDKLHVCDGYVGQTKLKMLRDTGCEGVVVKTSLVPQKSMTGEYKTCMLIDGTIRRFPVAMIEIDTPYLTGKVLAKCMENPVYGLIIGQGVGARDPTDLKSNWEPMSRGTLNDDHQSQGEDKSAAVVTRSQGHASNKPVQPLKVSQPMSNIVTVETLREEQAIDPTLKKIRDMEVTSQRKSRNTGSSFQFVKRNGIIFREFQAPNVDHGNTLQQVVVPLKFRKQVMHLAHESILGGHQGTKKTTDKVTSNFFWPGMNADITRYCQSCDICQRTVHKGRMTKVPLGSTPLIDTPFDRIAVDIVGPIVPCSARGHRYILVVVDYASRYPEAVPMKTIEAERVAEELVNIYTRLGIPREVLTDQGSQFTSNVMKEVSRLLSIKGLVTTPYNPKCNGLVERFNGTLKMMLKKMCDEKPKDWDRYIGPLLFAYRETPQESTGFAPFEILYGRTVRGPMQILKELWTKEIEHPETKSTYQYVLDLRDRLEQTCQIAKDALSKAKVKHKKYYDKKARSRQYEVGDEVLLLLPTDNNKLLMQWRGPYEIVKKQSSMDYTVDLGNRLKTFHINLLKKYIRRSDETVELSEANIIVETIQPQQPLEIVCTAVVEESDFDEFDDQGHTDGGIHITSKSNLIPLPTVEQTETYKDVLVNPKLEKEQINLIKRIDGDFQDVLSDIPNRSKVGCHGVKLTDHKAVRRKPYPVPHALRPGVEEELNKMEKLGIIERCESPYASPLVVVRSPGKKDRYAVDYRLINEKTVFDAEPVTDQTEIFAKLSNDRYFSKLDLTKGYWQIPMDKKSKPITAMITHQGLYQFNYMPFGMINSGATFCRVMRQVLKGLKNVDNYIDDILIHTPTFEEHIETLVEVLKRLREANLTAKPSKCFIAYFELEFLGHVIGKGQSKPRPTKVDAVVNAPRPETKSQLRSYLGLTGYYRAYIPNYAMIAAPLTDRTKKGEPNKVRWQESQQIAFEALKSKLVCSPVLKLPDIKQPFILRTDASDIGIAAVLLQEVEGEKFPVAYASKKLNETQRRYSVIEKECWAIVWGVQKFQSYLYGTEFIIETDHQPLKCVQRSKVANGRIMRWALMLQPYRYRIVVIRGKDNVGADYLSRAIRSSKES